MYLTYSLPLLMLWGRHTLAAKWTIDGDCDKVPIAQDIMSIFHGELSAFEEIEKAMHEAITMAEHAVNVLNDNADDEHVTGMMKLLFGDGPDYQAKVDETKRILSNVAGFEKQKAASGPFDKEWQDSMTNNDVMIFCSNGRYKQKEGSTIQLDTSMRNKFFSSVNFDDGSVRGECYKTDYDINGVRGFRTKAFTTPSELFDRKRYNEAGKPPDMSPFMVERPNIAYTIDICAWTLHQSALRGWPIIGEDLIKKTQQPGFKGGVTDIALPVDGLAELGYTMLHELTHTKQGGKTIDTPEAELPGGAVSCYGWKCTQLIKDPRNADNIAKAGMALHLWIMGYYVDKDGNVIDK